MRDLFRRMGDAMARFFYGRNGSDQLNLALLVLYLAVWVLQIIFSRSRVVLPVLNILSLALMVLVLFRMLSKNLTKRRAENQRFLAWWQPIYGRISGAKQRRQDKDHRYFTCKSCGTMCRVPAGKGKIELTCPKCGNKFVVKS